MRLFYPALFLLFFCEQLFAQCPNGGSLSGIELVVNGNFSGGNNGFTSQYTYCNYSQCLYPEAYYAVGTNPNFFHSDFYGFDHTTGTGKFLIVNGAGTANVSIWCETVAVQPNTTYIFSYWISSMVTGSPAILKVSMNGVLTGGFCNAPAALYTWTQCSVTWNSGSNTSVDLCIVNFNTALGGNDFGIDDISFQACNCSLSTVDAGPALSICSGDSAQLNASGGVSYTWINGATLSDTAIADPFAHPLSNTTYYVTVYDSLGCFATDSTTVTVNPLCCGK